MTFQRGATAEREKPAPVVLSSFLDETRGTLVWSSDMASESSRGVSGPEEHVFVTLEKLGPTTTTRRTRFSDRFDDRQHGLDPLWSGQTRARFWGDLVRVVPAASIMIDTRSTTA